MARTFIFYQYFFSCFESRLVTRDRELISSVSSLPYVVFIFNCSVGVLFIFLYVPVFCDYFSLIEATFLILNNIAYTFLPSLDKHMQCVYDDRISFKPSKKYVN